MCQDSYGRNRIESREDYARALRIAADEAEYEINAEGALYPCEVIDDEANSSDGAENTADALAFLQFSESEPREEVFKYSEGYEATLKSMAFSVFRQDLEAELESRGVL